MSNAAAGATDNPPASATTSGDGFFDLACKKAGLDPVAERKRFEAEKLARVKAEDDYFRVRAMRERVDSRVGQLTATGRRRRKNPLPKWMRGIKTKEQLRAFLIDLLMDDIVEAALGATSRRKRT